MVVFPQFFQPAAMALFGVAINNQEASQEPESESVELKHRMKRNLRVMSTELQDLKDQQAKVKNPTLDRIIEGKEKTINQFDKFVSDYIAMEQYRLDHLMKYRNPFTS